MRQIEDLMVAIFKRRQVTVSNVTLTFVIQCNNCAYIKLKIKLGYRTLHRVSLPNIFIFCHNIHLITN